MGSPRSKVEIDGFEAKYYDILMDILTLGFYGKTMKKAIGLMNLKKKDKVLDLGAGTGRNACIMRSYLDDKGEIVGLDISDIMLEKARKKCKKYDNVSFKKVRIEDEIPYKNYFDKAFISFVLHGFEQYDREKIVRNVYNALKVGGEFFVLDYSHDREENLTGIYRYFLTKVECPLAYEYVLMDQEKFLKEHGFTGFEYSWFFFKRVNLMKAVKI